MKFSTQIRSGSSPFKPATNLSHAINTAQHNSKINPKTIAQRLEVNQSRKNPYLLKRSSLVESMDFTPWSNEFRPSERRLSFLPLSLSFSSPSLFLSFFSFLPFSNFLFLFPFFLSFLFSPFCSPLVVSPLFITLQTPIMLTHGLPYVLEENAF